jgi:PDZ domain-containing protein/aspartyl protease
MKRVSRVAVAAIITAGACAHGRAAALQAPVTVPFELRGDFAIVNVEINGHPTRLILDSGSGALALDSVTADGVQVEMSMFAHGSAIGTGAPVRIGSAREVRVGKAYLPGVRVAVVNMGAVQARVGYDVHGTLGFELFNRYVVDLDYRARTMTLSEPSEFTYRGPGTEVPISIERNVPVTSASIVTRRNGTIPVRLTLDLGSSTWAVRLSSQVVRAHDLEHDTVTVQGVFGVGVDGVTQGSLMRMPELRLGALTIQRPSVALSHAVGESAPTDGTVGASIFSRARVIFDYSRSRVIIEPRGRLDLADSVDASGMTLALDAPPANGVSVVYVTAGSAAADAGVRAGDRILAIDAKPAASLSVADMRRLLRAAGTTSVVTVRRGTTAIDVRLHLRMIF